MSAFNAIQLKIFKSRLSDFLNTVNVRIEGDLSTATITRKVISILDVAMKHTDRESFSEVNTRSISEEKKIGLALGKPSDTAQ